MGTQQILLIVLTVIIVGVAVAGGIGMFNQQAKSSNRSAIIADMNLIAVQTMAYYRMPATMGGGGGEENIEVDNLKLWLGLPIKKNGDVVTGNGTIRIKSNDNFELVLIGFGNETGNDESEAVEARLKLREIGSTPNLILFN